MRFLVAWASALFLMLGLTGLAKADAPLVMDEPKSGLRLEVEGACQVRPADGGGAACRDFAASADKSERFAVVLGPNGLLFYSVAMFADPEPGGGMTRARAVAAKMGEAVVGTPNEVLHGGQRFLRAQLRTSNGAALCFITADEREEIAIIMFAGDPESFSAMEAKADAAMGTIRRTAKPAASAQTPPIDGAPMSRTSQALLSVFLVLVFGLPVVGFIRRAIRNARRKAAAAKPPS
jgi:hypothetical protein